MSNIYKDALIVKVNSLLVQLEKEGELNKHMGSQVRILEKHILGDELEEALKFIKVLIDKANVLSSSKVFNMIFDVKHQIESNLNIFNAEKGEEQQMKHSNKEANFDMELKCDKAPVDLKISIKGIKVKAHGNEFEMEEMEINSISDISNFVMGIKALMSKK